MTKTTAETIDQILTPGKGVLATDEGENSAKRNLAKANIEGTPENRRMYRELFIETAGVEKYLSGMILDDEMFWLGSTKGKRFTETLMERDIAIIVKVDEGKYPFFGSDKEEFTLGLDALKDRLPNYFENGARAAKWRSVFKISESTPTKELIDANATGLALYAHFCLENDIVPIVEPEVLLNGDHSFIEAQDVTSKVLRRVFEKLDDYGVDLKNVILKSSMVLPGKDSGEEVSPEEIASATVEVFKESVPAEIPGIVFLSGGQEPLEATNNLNAIAKANDSDWFMTFCFSRAIQGPALETWAGNDANIGIAREVFMKKLELDAKAMQGLL